MTSQKGPQFHQSEKCETEDSILARIRTKWQVQFEPLQVDEKSWDVLNIGNMPDYLNKLLTCKNIDQPLKELPLWAKIWPGSMILGRVLRKFEPQGKSLLELGCGLGVMSMIASDYGFSSITATDISSDALDFAKVHVLHNGLADKIEVKYLDITSHGTCDYDYIAASEILYLDELHKPLLKFLQRHLKGKAFFCTDMARNKPRFAKMAAKHFNIQQGYIGLKSDNAAGNERRIFNITILEKKCP